MSQRTIGQHVLPRLLLRGFVAFVKKEEEYTYVFRISTEGGVASNIRDAGKRRLFYGESAQTGIEDALQREENEYALAAHRIRECGAILEPSLETLLKLIANLSVRSNHLRTGMAREAERVFETAQDLFSGDQSVEIVRRLIKQDPSILREPIREVIRAIPDFPREPQLHLWLDRTLEQLVLTVLEGGQLPFSKELTDVLCSVAKQLDWQEIARAAHLQALEKGVAPATRVDLLRALSWEAIRTEPYALVLGDFGPLGVSMDQDGYRPLSVLGGNIRSVVLPLAHDLIVHGYREEARPTIDTADVSRASAAMSAEFFVAARDSDVERQYATLLGSQSHLLTIEEAEDIRNSLRSSDSSSMDDAPSLEHGISFDITLDGTRADPKVEEELQLVATVIDAAVGRTGLPMDVHARFLVTDDLARSAASTATDYGLEAAFDFEHREVPVWGKTLCSPEQPPLRATMMIREDLWENDTPKIVITRFQLLFSQVMQTLIVARRLAYDTEPTLDSNSTFDDQVRALACQMLDVHDAQHNALAFVRIVLTAHDENGIPVGAGAVLGPAYVSSTRELLSHLGQVALERIQEYRTTNIGLDQILPATIPVLRELLLVIAHMIGVAEDRQIATYKATLEDAAGFAEYLQEDWNDLVRAFRNLDHDEATETLSRIVLNILARMGLYIDDDEDDRSDLIVGTPRLPPR